MLVGGGEVGSKCRGRVAEHGPITPVLDRSKGLLGEKLLLINQMFSVSNVSVFRNQRIQCGLVCIKLFGGLWDGLWGTESAGMVKQKSIFL